MKFNQTVITGVALVLLVGTVDLMGIVDARASKPDRCNADILVQNSRAVSDVAHKAVSAVVSITAVKTNSHTSSSLDFALRGSEQATMGIGSGVIIKSDGVILTNYHLVENANHVTVSLDENEKYNAHILGSDPKTDLAILQIEQPPSKALPILSFGNSDSIQVGDWVLAVGSPFGLNHSVTTGIISAVGREQLGMLEIEDFIQTDAAINPGNSGGPLLNSKGEMIGINTAIFSQSGGFIGIGFAIPSKIAKQVTDEILDHGRVKRGWLGMSAQNLDKNLSKYFKAPTEQGALVSQMDPHGPATEASIRIGDVITRFNNQVVQSSDHLKSLVNRTKTPQGVPVELYRNGKKHSLVVSVREQAPPPKENPLRPLAGQAAVAHKLPESSADLGLTMQDLSVEFAEAFGIPVHSGALVMDVKIGSPAFEAGLSRGDIVIRSNKSLIKNADDFEKSIKIHGESNVTILYVQRGPEEKLFVPLSLN